MEWFGAFWLIGIGLVGLSQIVWGLRAIRTGTATVYYRFEVSRAEKPFEFWMIIAGRVFGFFVATVMFVHGAQFFGMVIL